MEDKSNQFGVEQLIEIVKELPNQLQRLQDDHEDKLEQVQKELEKANEKIKSHESKMIDLESTLETAREYAKNKNQEIKELKVEMSALQSSAKDTQKTYVFPQTLAKPVYYLKSTESYKSTNERHSFFTRREFDFFTQTLLPAVERYNLYCVSKVRIEDFIAVDELIIPKSDPNYESYRDIIKSSHVDFLLFSREHYKPILAIELDNDPSHPDKEEKKFKWLYDKLGLESRFYGKNSSGTDDACITNQDVLEEDIFELLLKEDLIKPPCTTNGCDGVIHNKTVVNNGEKRIFLGCSKYNTPPCKGYTYNYPLNKRDVKDLRQSYLSSLQL